MTENGTEVGKRAGDVITLSGIEGEIVIEKLYAVWAPEATAAPTAKPTAEHTIKPVTPPVVIVTPKSQLPTVAPTTEPTVVPTEAPTAEPTAESTIHPTAELTEEPVVDDPDEGDDDETVVPKTGDSCAVAMKVCLTLMALSVAVLIVAAKASVKHS